MIIDFHAHIWGGNGPKDKENLLIACKRYGINKLCISSVECAYPNEAEIRFLNEGVVQFMREQPELIYGFVYVNPSNPDALKVLRQGIEEYGMSGMKLWIATFCDDPKVFPLIEQCIAYNIPVMLHAWKKSVGQYAHESTGVHVANLAKQYPEAKLVMAHLGGNCYHGVRAIRDYPNVMTDFSGSIFRGDDLNYTVEQLGAERILFGSDMPGSYLVNLGQVEEAALTAEQRELIYYKNALRMLNRDRTASVQ